MADPKQERAAIEGRAFEIREVNDAAIAICVNPRPSAAGSVAR